MIWDTSAKKVDVTGRKLARDLLVHMLGGTVDIDEATLAERLGEDFDCDDLDVLGEVEAGDGENEDEEEEDSADEDEDEEEEDDDEDEDDDEADEDDEDDGGEDARGKKRRRRG